ncbi:fungal specific transcription factor domain-containing protein [Nannizzia gypsea CBS 118893]|uniref:C6 finger domain transcription factor nscR n=1 Tax=Arthroderma gypseum (strain ATCC MYA-4604 / CBS 118893) TaxID=535722 RepID=E4UW65_ARTGP|nr:fungal specific transcription factor domain-containing protein [Nannizzia gypsea CBS 118893]EFR01673.1 fungal specific transcription factor domain-containing protein [Nannizzia gypsea CBS 118893]
MSDPGGSQLPEVGAGKTPRGRARLLSSRRRERPLLSCTLCRRMKLRCDRQQPCGTCTQRSLGSSCSYASNTLQPGDGAQPRVSTMQDRLKHLETLVVDLMQKTSDVQERENSPHTADDSNPFSSGVDIANTASPASDYGSIRLTASGTSYVNSTHWAAILNEISDIKDHFEREEEAQVGPQPTVHNVSGWTGPLLLHSSIKPMSREEILSLIPPRSTVDRLVSHYFNFFEMSPATLHSFQFLEEVLSLLPVLLISLPLTFSQYEKFWEDPSAAPIIWLGLLFTIMCLATLFQRFRLDSNVQNAESLLIEQDLQKSMESFRQNIVNCLILGNYTQGGPYVLETLILYFTVELFIHTDTEIGVWILLGTIVQLAMHMGYHRDPKHFDERISPFIGEMRKRVWATIIELDLGISIQMGLPRLINPWQADTSEPSNLLDSDFNQAIIDMPPSRPETDLTPMLYRLVKSRVMSTVGYIWDFAADTRSYTYAEVMKMDKRLHDAHEAIPECLKWHSMAQCILDTPQVIMQKLSLDIILHRARIILHRKYSYCSPTRMQHSQSQQACLNAALKLLEYQHILHEETRPFCRLYQERWRVSSLINHDFLLATSILCFYVQQTRGVENNGSDVLQTETIWAALQRSNNIWLKSSDLSKEAQRAVKALSVVLGTSHSISNTRPEIEINTSIEQMLDTTILRSWASPTNDNLRSFFSPTFPTNADQQEITVHSQQKAQ